MRELDALKTFCSIYGYTLKEDAWHDEEAFYKYPYLCIHDAVQFGRDFESFIRENWVDANKERLNDFEVEYLSNHVAFINWKRIRYE